MGSFKKPPFGISLLIIICAAFIWSNVPAEAADGSLFNPKADDRAGVLEAPGNYAGRWNSDPLDPESVSNPFSRYGSPYSPDSIHNPYGPYGSPYSDKSWNNPYATNAPRLVDENGAYRGRLSSNPHDPDSISNPYGRFGNPYSPDSINNPYNRGKNDLYIITSP